MRFEFEDTKRIITDEELLADLCRVATLLGTGVLTQRAYRDVGGYSTTAIKKRFGKWKTAVTTAGFGAGAGRDIPVEELFDNLREVWIKLGRQPRKREMVSPVSKYTHHPYVRVFDGWVDAMRAFTRTANEAEVQAGSAKNLQARDPRGPREPSLRLRFLVMRRDHFKCVVCDRTPATDPTTELHIDHILAWSNEGGTEMSNLRTLCSLCNLGKADLAAHLG